MKAAKPSAVTEEQVISDSTDDLYMGKVGSVEFRVLLGS